MSAIAEVISNSNLNNNEWMYLINIARKSNKNISFQALHYSDPVRHGIKFYFILFFSYFFFIEWLKLIIF